MACFRAEQVRGGFWRTARRVISCECTSSADVRGVVDDDDEAKGQHVRLRRLGRASRALERATSRHDAHEDGLVVRTERARRRAQAAAERCRAHRTATSRINTGRAAVRPGWRSGRRPSCACSHGFTVRAQYGAMARAGRTRARRASQFRTPHRPRRPTAVRMRRPVYLLRRITGSGATIGSSGGCDGKSPARRSGIFVCRA